MKRFWRHIKNHFVPHQGNGYEPHLLRHQATMSILLLVILIELVFLLRVLVLPTSDKFLAAVLPSVLTDMTNTERQNHSLTQLSTNPLLVRAAQMKADDMATRGYFAHTTPDGKSPWYWLDEAGYDYRYAGENLAVNFFESDQIARAWMNSVSHRANIVKPEYQEIGIAIADGVYQGQNTVFVVQFFGTQKEKPMLVAKDFTDTPVVTLLESVPPSQSISQFKKVESKSNPILTSEKPVEEVQAEDSVSEVLGEDVSEVVEKTNYQIVNTESVSLPKKGLLYNVVNRPFGSVTSFLVGSALFLIALLLIVLFVRAERKHPLVILRGFGLISFIIFLLYLNTELVHIMMPLPASASYSFAEFVPQPLPPTTQVIQ